MRKKIAFIMLIIIVFSGASCECGSSFYCDNFYNEEINNDNPLNTGIQKIFNRG